MLYLDTCVVLALLTPEVHTQAATAFVEQATEMLAISSWTATELHSALAFKVRSGALNAAEGDRVLAGLAQPLAKLNRLPVQHHDHRDHLHSGAGAAQDPDGQGRRRP
ncbi:MAG: type II toxin-antitoxin system VapC family toxin [Cyanobacteriota bacterium]